MSGKKSVLVDGVVVYFDSTGRLEEYPSPPSWLRELQLIEEVQ